MKRLLIGSLVLSLILVTGFYASQALFSARSQKPGGTFTVGTLDLSVTDPMGKDEAFSINNIGETPSTEGKKVWKIKNTGSLSGRLSLSATKYKNLENGCNDQEAKVDITCEDPGEGQGELGNTLQARILVNDKEEIPWSNVFKGEEELTSVWSKLPEVVLGGGQEVILTLEWRVREGDYGNEIQSDGLDFNVAVNLEQAK